MFESMIHDIEEDSKRVLGCITIDRVSILVDIVVNQGNDTLEARGIARIDFAICGDKMVAPALRGSMLELPSLQKM
eukprot:scaffold832_cov75-Skeletonema_dohrnii-CCMP3373.AAC.3